MKKEAIINLTFDSPKKVDKDSKKEMSDTPINKKNRFILERKILTKTHNPLNDLLLNHKEENKFFVSKTRRIGKYNPNNKISKKELIIDTRNELIQTPKSNVSDFYKNHKYLQFRNKNKSPKNKSKKENPQKIIRLKTYSFDSIPYYFIKNIKPYDFNVNMEPENPQKVKSSLYSILPTKKNQFMEAFNQAKENEKKWKYLPKSKQRQFIMDKTPMANFYSRKKDIKSYMSNENSPLTYISILDDDFLISEKLRFQNMMYKLTKLKTCIENNPKKEYDIIKEFLLSNKLFDVVNFEINKLKNFLHFIKGDILLDPTKNFKENILDILNGNEIERPQISKNLNELNNTSFKNELIKQNLNNIQNNLHMNEIIDNEDCIVKNLKRYPPKILTNQNETNSPQVINQQKTKNKIDINNNYNPIYNNTLTKAEIIERLLKKKYHEVEKVHNKNSNFTDKEKEKIKNFICLQLNLRRQKEIYLSCINDNFDLNNNPQFIIKLLEKKFKEEEKENMDMRAKTVSNWKNIMKSKNEKLYGEKKNNSDYEELKKRNMLTEYICLMKAKNKYEINKLNEKYKL